MGARSHGNGANGKQASVPVAVLPAERPAEHGPTPGPDNRVPFPSVLFLRLAESITAEEVEEPGFFRDLNLDQIVGDVTYGFGEYHLAAYFRARPRDLESVTYRQEVMLDLEAGAVLQAVHEFSDGMRLMRERAGLAQKRHYKQQKERTFLSSAAIYCEAVKEFGKALASLELRSAGMRAFREYFVRYVESAEFQGLVAEVAKLTSDLASIRYSLTLHGEILVQPYQEAEDYSAVIERTFERFRRGAVEGFRRESKAKSDMNHIEAAILDRVARLNPEKFLALEAFSSNHARYVDEGIARFDREVQFYVAYLKYIGRLREGGLSFCYPQLQDSSKEIEARDTFDLALAARQAAERAVVVTNDFYLRGRERIFVVTGPNQGGKTTFARTFGQIHYLATLGCAVPGTAARLHFFDQLFTHFEREEVAANLRGKLRDDLIRIRRVLDAATPNSIVIMNEIFASTTVKDAVFLGTEILGRLCRLDLLAVCVTFLSELATLDVRTVSMTSTVEPADPSIRTFKVVRQPASGLAYAMAIARKHRVTYEQLVERLGS